MKEQTAIEWLVNELKSLGIYSSTLKEKCEQAKEIEKQQIFDTYRESAEDWSELSRKTINKLSEEYYNKTFKQE